MKNVHFDWFNHYLCTGEHFQSNLDIFQFDFMFVKPKMCPHCFALMCKLKWDFDYNSSFLQRLPSENMSCCNQNLISVCMLKQSSGCTSFGFTNIKSHRNMSKSDWKCSPVHNYWLNQPRKQQKYYYVLPRVGEWVAQRDVSGDILAVWVRSCRFGCLVTWFCYQMMANQVTRQPHLHDLTHLHTHAQGSFWVCAKPMSDNVTM